jgi:glucan 1,3-beta-glucosidase
MKFFKAAICSVFIWRAASEHLKIPEVDNIVGQVLKHYGDYVHYQGNHSEASAGTKRQSGSYWYETINHQGISAFGPSGYKVFRNVKDYGATGKRAFN